MKSSAQVETDANKRRVCPDWLGMEERRTETGQFALPQTVSVQNRQDPWGTERWHRFSSEFLPGKFIPDDNRLR